MYSLRVVTKHETVNHTLGKTYVRIDRFYQDDNFRKVYKDTFGKDHVADLDPEADQHTQGVVAFIMGEETYPIYADEFTYIVGPSGDTYECINNPNKVGKKIA